MGLQFPYSAIIGYDAVVSGHKPSVASRLDTFDCSDKGGNLLPLNTVRLSVSIDSGPDSHLEGTGLVIEFNFVISGECTFDLLVDGDDGY